MDAKTTGPKDQSAILLRSETRPDGTILVQQETALGPYPRCMTERFLHWADHAPDRLWMAERANDGAWRSCTYGQGAQAIQAIGTALLQQGLSVERPLLILSGNSLAHALMALAAQHVGIPSAALAPAYALSGGDLGKLKQVVEQLTPGMIFADHAEPFSPAMDAVIDPHGKDFVDVAVLMPVLPDPLLQEAHGLIGGFLIVPVGAYQPVIHSSPGAVLCLLCFGHAQGALVLHAPGGE